MTIESNKAVKELNKYGISCELVDLRTIKPLDIDTIVQSVSKTGKVLIADGGWKSYGVAAEIIAVIQENCFYSLKAPIKRVTLPDIPTPAANSLEKAYYPTFIDIINETKDIFNQCSVR